jgi:hypothetical protein
MISGGPLRCSVNPPSTDLETETSKILLYYFQNRCSVTPKIGCSVIGVPPPNLGRGYCYGVQFTIFLSIPELYNYCCSQQLCCNSKMSKQVDGKGYLPKFCATFVLRQLEPRGANVFHGLPILFRLFQAHQELDQHHIHHHRNHGDGAKFLMSHDGVKCAIKLDTQKNLIKRFLALPRSNLDLANKFFLIALLRIEEIKTPTKIMIRTLSDKLYNKYRMYN